jgi:hypothetical protein
VHVVSTELVAVVAALGHGVRVQYESIHRRRAAKKGIQTDPKVVFDSDVFHSTDLDGDAPEAIRRLVSPVRLANISKLASLDKNTRLLLDLRSENVNTDRATRESKLFNSRVVRVQQLEACGSTSAVAPCKHDCRTSDGLTAIGAQATAEERDPERLLVIPHVAAFEQHCVVA